MMKPAVAPVDQLLVAGKDGAPHYEPIYGGYTNAKGAVSLFAQDLAFRIVFKTRTIQQKPALNPGAQERYDAASPGEAFHYGGSAFRRLSAPEIAEICASGPFRMGLRSL